jgi:hypothetical protein
MVIRYWLLVERNLQSAMYTAQGIRQKPESVELKIETCILVNPHSAIESARISRRCFEI